MEVKEISKESGKIKIEAVIARTDIEEGKKKVYAKEKNKYSIPGFRKGRVPMKMIERQYGNVFLEAAIDNLVNEAYQKALVDFSIDPILPPKLDFPEKANFDDDLKIGIDITAVPEIKVKDYLGVKIKEEKKEVKDQDIKKELKNLQERNSRLERVSRPSKSGDTVYIDFTGFIDGKKFAGGEAENYPLLLGSNSFIPGFEDQLIGGKGGDTIKVKVKFPEDYKNKDLAGKDAVFETKILNVKEKILDEINDEFAANISEFENLNDLEKDIKRKLEENLKATTEKEQKEKVLQKIFDANKLDIPNPMIEIALDEMMDEANSMFSSQGVNLNEYLKSLGKDQKAYRESLREDAKKRAKSKLIMGGIARQEGIEIAEKDIWKEIERLAKAYQTPVEKLKEQLNDLAIQKIKEDIKGRKAVDLIYEAAIVEEA